MFFLVFSESLHSWALTDGFEIFLTDSEALKTAFSSLMRSKPDIVSKHLHNLEDRILEMKRLKMDISPICGDLFLQLNSQFPEDVGCFCIYFLNYIKLKPGEAMFLGSNLPHAYLAGGKIITIKQLFLKPEWAMIQ